MNSVSVSKPAEEGREGFDEAAAEDPVAGEHVGDHVAEDMPHDAGQHPVAEAVAAPVALLGRIDAQSRHHVELLAGEHLDHGWCIRRVVGPVAIDQHIGVGLDIGEHPAHDVAFALAPLLPDGGAGARGNACRVVRRIIVIDEDTGIGQGAAEVGDNLADGDGFVPAGDEDGDFQTGHSTAFGRPLVVGGRRRRGGQHCAALAHRNTIRRDIAKFTPRPPMEPAASARIGCRRQSAEVAMSAM